MSVLSEETIEIITGYKRTAAQYQALIELGLDFVPRPRDGFPLVLQKHFEKVMGQKEVKRDFAPDFGALK